MSQILPTVFYWTRRVRSLPCLTTYSTTRSLSRSVSMCFQDQDSITMFSCFVPKVYQTCVLLPQKCSKLQIFSYLFSTHLSCFVSSVRSSNSHPDLLLTHYHQQQQTLFQITPVLNTGLSLSEPLQLYKGYNAI